MKALLFAAAALTVGITPAQADTTCTGDEYYVTCESKGYDYEAGSYTCRASGNPNYLTWTCSSY